MTSDGLEKGQVADRDRGGLNGEDGSGKAAVPVSDTDSGGSWLSRFAYRMLVRCHRWAESGWGGAAVAGWGLLQSSVVPGPSDAVLVPLGIADPGKVFRLAAWATLGATAGGLIAYTIGLTSFDHLGRPLLDLMGVSPARLDASRAAFARHGWQIVLLSTMSPLSTKAICLAAGAFGVPAWQFLPALLVGRGLRFLAVALAIRLAGPRLLNWLSKKVGQAPVASISPDG